VRGALYGAVDFTAAAFPLVCANDGVTTTADASMNANN
jgi:hypothetical protein